MSLNDFSKKLLIAAPVYKRNWILPLYFDRILSQNGFENKDLGFLFLLSRDDPETFEFLTEWNKKHSGFWTFEVCFDDSPLHQEHHKSGMRQWNQDRYQHMANLRNKLLARARELSPNRYFSLDTDILLDDPNTFAHLWNLTEDQADVASPLMFMTPNGITAPSTMTWSDDDSFRARRTRTQYPYGRDFITDVVMAAKMMNRSVYEQVDYQTHRQGEDLGWAKNCALAGKRLVCASSIYAVHVMSEKMLEEYNMNGDERVRKLNKLLEKQ